MVRHILAKCFALPLLAAERHPNTRHLAAERGDSGAMHTQNLFIRLPRKCLVRKPQRLLQCRASSPHHLRHTACTPAKQLSQLVFPHSDSVLVEGKIVPCEKLVGLLSTSTSDERLKKMQQVIGSRSYSVVPVVEGLHDMGNLAAVCRSADAMGFGALHCIMQPTDKYKRSQRTAAGSDKWLDTRLWNSTSECLSSFRADGYQVVVTHLSSSSVTVQEIDWTRPTAFVLGNEFQGVSATAVQLADHTAVIPMAGFVESFNISVAAAIIMYEAQQQRIRRLGRSGDLTEQQKQQLLASFLLRGVKNSQSIVSELLGRPPPPHQRKFFRNPQQLHHQLQDQQQPSRVQETGTADAGSLVAHERQGGTAETTSSNEPPRSDPAAAAPSA